MGREVTLPCGGFRAASVVAVGRRVDADPGTEKIVGETGREEDQRAQRGEDSGDRLVP